MKFLLPLFLLLFGTATVYGQKTDSLRTGNELKKWKNLKERTVRFTIFTSSKEGKLLHYSILERTTKPFSFNGMDTWVAIQTYYGKDDSSVDSTVFLPKTYLPVAYRSDVPSEKHKEKVDFDGKKITAQIIYPDSMVMKDQSAAFPVYSVVMDQDVIQAIPLSNGYKFALWGINPGAHYRGVKATTYEVVGEEKLEIGGVMINCWKIAAGNMVMWCSKKSQELMKQQFLFPNGNVFLKIRLL